ncbi:MAG: DUF1569 domain-containing protein [Gemmatimonadota bacterium]|nr:DUF1569 domain-containing protein [Gemmatimonadota bacterium]
MRYPSIRDEGRRAEIERRIRSLTPESERRWGRMDHGDLLVHLQNSFRLAMEGSRRAPAGPLRFPPFRYLALHLVKWPEGKIQAPPGAFDGPSGTFEEGRRTLLELLDAYFERPESELGEAHPIFGRMKPHDWGVFLYRHLDHHLRQFSA